MKRSIVLVEVIFSIVLFSIVIVYSMNILITLYKTNNSKVFQTSNNIKLETTRLFLIKNNDFSLVEYSDGILKFDNNLLLNNISSYNIDINNSLATIDICIFENKICQVWKIKI